MTAEADRSSPTASSTGRDTAQRWSASLLACFDGASGAAKVRRALTRQLGDVGEILDEVILRVSGKRKVRVYDPRRTIAGTLTPALTWGVFGALAGGGWSGLAIWAVLGALCGGVYAYFAERTLSKNELRRIGKRLPADSSAITVYVKSADAEQILR